MEMYLSSLKWMFESLEHWLRGASARERVAIDLFLDALNKTQNYLGSLERDIANANPQSEMELSEAWTAAAKAVRSYDPDLYQRCLAKACHWSGSDRFKQSEIADVNISIQEMINIAVRKGDA